MCLQAAAVASVLLALGASAYAPTKTLAERLGYPTDAKRLIVHDGAAP